MINKICLKCNKLFTARRQTTKYCSMTCNRASRNYSAMGRMGRIGGQNHRGENNKGNTKKKKPTISKRN